MWFDGIRQPNTIYVANVSRGKDSTAMLRAIQLLGFPLDYIVSVDIWFDDDTPAELPPMVAFKDEWDAKCLKTFGVPVTRLCATTTVDKKHQPKWGGINAHTQTYSTSGKTPNDTENTSMGSPALRTGGVKNLNSGRVKLTYCDIFYRKVSPERERERENVAMRQKLERELPNLRLSPAFRELVSVDAQTISTYGFANQRCRWCTGELKKCGITGFRAELLRGVNPASKGRFSTEKVFFRASPQHERAK